jgi:hypothetical protein
MPVQSIGSGSRTSPLGEMGQEVAVPRQNASYLVEIIALIVGVLVFLSAAHA